MYKPFFLPLMLLAIGLLAGCIPDPISAEEQLASDVKKIKAYLEENNLVAQSNDTTGLHFIIEEPGSGGYPSLSDKVTVNYKGYLLNGSVFDETKGTPVSFGLNQVIEGWQLGIPLFQKGGKGKLFIPSGLAYGNSGSGSIPPRTPIAFDVELVDF